MVASKTSGIGRKTAPQAWTVGIINIYTAADKESPELNSSLINTYTLIIKIRIGSPTIRTIH